MRICFVATLVLSMVMGCKPRAELSEVRTVVTDVNQASVVDILKGDGQGGIMRLVCPVDKNVPLSQTNEETCTAVNGPIGESELKTILRNRYDRQSNLLQQFIDTKPNLWSRVRANEAAKRIAELRQEKYPALIRSYQDRMAYLDAMIAQIRSTEVTPVTIEDYRSINIPQLLLRDIVQEFNLRYPESFSQKWTDPTSGKTFYYINAPMAYADQESICPQGSRPYGKQDFTGDANDPQLLRFYRSSPFAKDDRGDLWYSLSFWVGESHNEDVEKVGTGKWVSYVIVNADRDPNGKIYIYDTLEVRDLFAKREVLCISP